ncbi:hypothetical protein ACE01N_05950 [Saccharicrinis sp. FJH2]|uniref:MutS-related protein n=1 Tax=Saccharicrinis sp. FJH65 TaxID=3344659 RepID=UPI0035F4C6FD
MFKQKKIRKEELLQSFGKPSADEVDIDLIAAFFNKKDKSDTYHVISYKTCLDLDLDTLFQYLDRTTSPVGKQVLYDKLRTIYSTENNKDKKEALIQKFMDDPEFRVSVQLKLNKVDHKNGYYIPSLFQDEHLEPPRWFSVIKFLSFTSVASLILLPFNISFLFIVLALFAVNTVIHYWNKNNLYQYLGSIPQLLKLNAVARDLYQYNDFKFIDDKVPQALSVLNKIRNRMSFFRLESGLQSEIQAITWGILELFKILFLIEPLLLFDVLKLLDTRRDEIETLFTFTGEIDALISIASLRSEPDQVCIPEISDKSQIIADSVYHPLIEDCVVNSINTGNKSVLLTGSNMSGKTTFIRTIGLNVITALTLNTCFAKSFITSRFAVSSAIRISDDLLNDKSYYFEEVLTIKSMIDASVSGKSNFFLLDEIFKGTNTVERISAGKAVLSELSRNGNLVFVSTHDIELTDLLQDSYELYHFSERVEHSNVDFDYILKRGKLTQRNAIRILEINGYPESVIKEAVTLSQNFDEIFRKS